MQLQPNLGTALYRPLIRFLLCATAVKATCGGLRLLGAKWQLFGRRQWEPGSRCMSRGRVNFRERRCHMSLMLKFMFWLITEYAWEDIIHFITVLWILSYLVIIYFCRWTWWKTQLEISTIEFSVPSHNSISDLSITHRPALFIHSLGVLVHLCLRFHGANTFC